MEIKYLIFGNGFIGNKFKNYLGDEAILSKRRIKSIKDIYLELVEHKPEIVINCVGKTGRPNVDWCETHKDESFFSNVTVPTLLAEVCEDTGIYLVHIGSGCIYQGDIDGDGWFENDVPNFFGSFYSRTKIYSQEILKWYSNVLQLRIRMPIDDRPGPRNLIDKLINYDKVIGDEKNSVTCIPDLLNVSKKLMERKETGVWNIVQSGAITHREILSMYKDIVDSKFKMPEFIGVGELKELRLVKAGRSNCILSTRDLKLDLGIEMREVHEALKECMEEYRKWI